MGGPRLILTVQPLLPPKIDSLTAGGFPSLRLVIAKWVRVSGAVVFAICAVIFGCDLFLDRVHLWWLFATIVVSMILFRTGRKLESSSPRIGNARLDDASQPLCRRQAMPERGEFRLRPRVTCCGCEPWRCEEKHRSTCFVARESENVAACARSLSQKTSQPLTFVADATRRVR